MTNTTSPRATAWHENRDYSPYWPIECRTRNAPSRRWAGSVSLGDVAGFTPDQDEMVSSAHEAGHAVMFMASGRAIEYIVVYDDQATHNSKGAVQPVDRAGKWVWLDYAIGMAAGERAADRYMREARLWSAERAWVIERWAMQDRVELDDAVRQVHGRAMTFGVRLDDQADYAWICDQADQALARYWPQVMALARHVYSRGHVPGPEAARVAGF